jgi:hypothetical protein
MRRLALFTTPLLALSTSALSADLDGPVYRERDVVIERPAPRIIERERIVEHHHHHYQPVPVYQERRVYVEPRYYASEDVFYARPRAYRHVHAGWWRPRHFFPRGHYWHRHHHRGW